MPEIGALSALSPSELGDKIFDGSVFIRFSFWLLVAVVPKHPFGAARRSRRQLAEGRRLTGYLLTKGMHHGRFVFHRTSQTRTAISQGWRLRAQFHRSHIQRVFRGTHAP